MTAEKLSALERQLLNIESRMSARRPTAAEIRGEIELTATRSHQLLWTLFDDAR